MSRKQSDVARLKTSIAEAHSRLTALIAQGYELHEELKENYQARWKEGIWDRDQDVKALKLRADEWCEKITPTFASIFPTDIEHNQLHNVVGQPRYADPKTEDIKATGLLIHFKLILEKMIVIRDTQLVGYAAANDQSGPNVHPATLAKAFLFEEPDISPTDLANRVGVSRGTLYSNSPKWRDIARTLRARNRDKIPKGVKSKDGFIEAEHSHDHENYESRDSGDDA
jgi:hypothetical protein